MSATRLGLTGWTDPAWAETQNRMRAAPPPESTCRARDRIASSAAMMSGSDSGCGRRSTESWVAGGLAVVLAVAGLAAWSAGLLAPRLEWTDGMSWEVNDSGRSRLTVDITNTGVLPVTVIDAGRSRPGMELLAVEDAFPVRIEPDETRSIVLVYQITACDVPSGAWPVQVRVARFWGEQAVDVRGHPGSDVWARQLVESWCDRPA